MKQKNSFIRGAVTKTLSGLLDLLSVVTVLFCATAGYYKWDDLEAVIGGLVGLCVSALVFGTIYVLLAIMENTRDAAETAQLAFQRDSDFLGTFWERMNLIEQHLARIDNSQIRNQVEKSVGAAISASTHQA